MFENIIAGAAAANEASNKAEPGDYIKDGLLYCGKCNTPRQKEIELLPGKIFKPYVKCQCRAQQETAAKEEKKRLGLRFRGSENQRIIDMHKTREIGEIVIWQGVEKDKTYNA